MLIRISLVAGSRPGALIPRGGWGSFLFPGGRRTFRAGILNRAKFAEWLRAPQRGSRKWPIPLFRSELPPG